MNREKAEKLLAALLFDDLDASSKAELTDYLQTDDELRERLADMRLAVKVTSDAVQNEPEQTLDKKHLNKLAWLAEKSNHRPVHFTMRRLIAAAAVLAVIALPALFILLPSLQMASSPSSQMYAMTEELSRYDIEFTGGTSAVISNRQNAHQNGKPVVDLAGGTSTFDKVDSDGMDYQRAAGTSTESNRQIAQVFDYEYTPERSLGGGIYNSIISEDKSGSDARGYQFGTDIQGSSTTGYTTFNDNSATTSFDSRVAAPAVVAQEPAQMDNFSVSVRGSRGVSIDNVDQIKSDIAAVSGPQTVASRARSRTSTTVASTPPPAKPAETPKPIPGEWGRSAPDDLGSKKQVFLGVEIAEIPQAAQNGFNGDTATVGEKLNYELSAGKGSELSKEGLKSLADEYREFDSAVAVNNSESIPISEGIPELGRLFSNRASAPEVEESRSSQPVDEALKESETLAKLFERRRSQQFERQRTRQNALNRPQDIIENAHDGDVIVEGKAKVPILGDIPLVGGLYKIESTKDTAVKEYGQSQAEAVELNKRIRDFGETEYAGALDQKQEKTSKYMWRGEPVDGLYGPDMNGLLVDREKASMTLEESRLRNWDEVGQTGTDLLTEEINADIPVEDITDLPLASRFKSIPVNPWVMTERDSLSTFALDVDTASYTLSRRYISSGYLPPAGAVRMEEFINYFNYQYPQQSDRTFRVYAEAAPSPFAGEGKNLTLLKIGVKARTIGRDQYKAAHLVFVIDTSASMGQPERLPLIQKSLNLLLDGLTPADRITLITCSDQARLLLDSVPVSERERIRQVINAVQPSGTTNLLAGLQLGYATARRAYSAKQINQVILCSDGVANVGQTEAEAVLKAVEQDRKQGITITCVGVGYGTYNDAFMESLADQGDGRYVFLDSLRQAQRVFVEQLDATLHTVAKDARIQVSFNPERVRRYRLIGYENRDIEDTRFRDDTIDAGEVGSGQCSTALYELELINGPSASQLDNFGTVFVRYRDVDTDRIEEISSDLENTIIRKRTVENSPYFYLAAATAQFAEILRQSEHVQDSNLVDVLTVAEKVRSVLRLDRDVRELADLIRRSEHLPRAQ